MCPLLVFIGAQASLVISCLLPDVLKLVGMQSLSEGFQMREAYMQNSSHCKAFSHAVSIGKYVITIIIIIIVIAQSRLNIINCSTLSASNFCTGKGKCIKAKISQKLACTSFSQITVCNK